VLALARTLESCARKDDLIFRWGEEFVLLLPRTSLDSPQSRRSDTGDGGKVTLPGLPFTVSIGVARHETNESIDELFKRVDDALYKAKNEGRNRVLAA
jgi:diguanylate cyclase (GGDEF)-like protein